MNLAKTLEQMPEVSYLVLTLGACGLVVEVYCRDHDHLKNLITDKIQSIKGVRSTETLVIGKLFKLGFFWQPKINSQTEGK
jgi:Lrp/AsnC family transcriptional regulator for asnA, asnC and gidA